MLKPILHALLIPGTLSFLSFASNRRLKAPAYRLIGAYIAKVCGPSDVDAHETLTSNHLVQNITISGPFTESVGQEISRIYCSGINHTTGVESPLVKTGRLLTAFCCIGSPLYVWSVDPLSLLTYQL